MKRLFLFVALLACGAVVQAQVVLTYKSHGLVAGTKNHMQLTTFTDPGISGSGVYWDFSASESVGGFLGSLETTLATRANTLFLAGNTTLEEFGNLFVFNTNEQIQEQWGFLSGVGDTRIQYTKPFVKMKFPFTFGSKFSGDFAADYFVGNKAVGTIDGSYTVEGDGQGTLMLPNGKEHKNVLRVREVKLYEMVVGNQRYAYVDESIRWYSQSCRYPLLVLIKSSVVGLNGGNGVPSVTTRAAYSTVSPAKATTPITETSQEASAVVNVYPNPFHEKVTIAVTMPSNGVLIVDVFDVSGRLVKQLASETVSAGKYTYSFESDSKVAEGVFIVRVNANNQLSTYRIVEMK